MTVTPPEPPPDAGAPEGGGKPPDAPHADRYRSTEPSPPEEIRRKLLFGVALVLSLASVYVGLLLQAPGIQYTLVGLAIVVAFVALLTGAQPPAPPSAGGPPAAGPPGGGPPAGGPQSSGPA